MSGDVESALGGDFLAVLRHHADKVRPHFQRDGEDLRRVAHFEVQLGGDLFTQQKHIRVLDVTAVGAEMHGDAVRARSLGGERGGEHGGLRVRGFQHLAIARLTQGDDVVDIDAEKEFGGHGRARFLPSLYARRKFFRQNVTFAPINIMYRRR